MIRIQHCQGFQGPWLMQLCDQVHISLGDWRFFVPASSLYRWSFSQTGGLSHTQKSQTGWSLSYTDDLFHRLGVYRMVFLTDWWSLSYTDDLFHRLGVYHLVHLTDWWSFSQTGGLCHTLMVFVTDWGTF